MDCIVNSDGVYVTTMNPDNLPETRIMFNLRNGSKFPKLTDFFSSGRYAGRFFFGTNTSSEKVTHIKKNNTVTVYYAVPENFMGLMINGRGIITDDMSIKEALWHENWTIYYPKGVTDPDYTVFELVPHFAKGWYAGTAFKISWD